MKKAIKIVIVGGPETGKTTLAKAITKIITDSGRELRVFDDGDTSFFRDEENVPADFLYNSVETFRGRPPFNELDWMGVSLFIDLDHGCLHDKGGYIPEELRQPITNAATAQMARAIYRRTGGSIGFGGSVSSLDFVYNARIQAQGGMLADLSEIKKEVDRAKFMTRKSATLRLREALRKCAAVAVSISKRKGFRAFLRLSFLLATVVTWIGSALLIPEDGADFLSWFLLSLFFGVLYNTVPRG